MSRFIEGETRTQATLFPEQLDDYVTEENAVRVIDVFIDGLDLSVLGFKTEPAVTGRPAYHPSILLKLFIYGYLNRIQSTRRLEREAARNIELMWLLSRLAPDFKTIADFRKNNTKAITQVCREFVLICRKLNLFSESLIAIDGSKFKAVNKRGILPGNTALGAIGYLKKHYRNHCCKDTGHVPQRCGQSRWHGIGTGPLPAQPARTNPALLHH